jgi:protein involved in polysaccharide export with SLBB domain
MRRSIWSPLIATALTLLIQCGALNLAAASDYTVRVGDKLKIRVHQFPELSGEFTVSSAGSIFMPPIGEIPVGGLPTKDISAQVSDYLVKAGYSQRPGAIVELLQSPPVFILGEVQRPGEYPYRPGLTILRAISLAGGHFRLTDPGLMRLERDAIAARGELAVLGKKVNYLLARRARLLAELESQSEIQFPPELTQQASDPTIAQLQTEERNILSTNRETSRSQAEGLEKARVLYEGEIQAIKTQIEAGKRELESVRKEFAEISSLRQKGLASWARELTLERSQAQLMAAEQGLQTLILRARQNMAQLTQRVSELQSDRRMKLNAEMQQTRQELEESRSRIETTRKFMTEAEVTTPTMTVRRTSRGLAKEYSYLIVRTQDGKATNLPADENTPLEPGDVIKVDRDDPTSQQLGAGIMPTRPIGENARITEKKQGE